MAIKDIIEIKGVTHSFGGDTILDEVSMNFPQGRLIAITGTAGSGKSTLLKIAAGLIRPDTGNVVIDGVEIFSISRNALLQMRRDFCFVFQDAALISNLTVYSNIALPLRYHYNLSERDIEEKVHTMLDNFGLMGVRNILPAHLSMGQRKLIGFARALITEPKLIFFDEPVAGIDAIARGKMTDKIIPLRDNPDITMIIVSHNLDFIKGYADYIALLHERKLIVYGKRDEVLKSSDPILQNIMSIIVDEEAVIAEEVLGLLTGKY